MLEGEHGSEVEMRTFERLCPYCGKTRTCKSKNHWHNHIGWTTEDIEDAGCDCLLGKLEHNNGKIQIKKQCANCIYNKNGCCINEQERNEISTLFGIENLVIKDKSKRCAHYELSKEILDVFIELVK